ncbi:MAG: hypothetical protein JW797_02215 [Bradymonadales bacterium]|nr:hypothetical protein [Bradymonadales bacterium]
MMRMTFYWMAVIAATTGILACGDEITEDACHGVTCSGHGRCQVQENGEAECACDDGYLAEDLTCVDDGCGAVPWVANEDATDALVSDGALHLNATGTEEPTISYSITGAFDVHFLVLDLSPNARVTFTARGGDSSVVASMSPDLAIAGWINETSPEESLSDFRNAGGSGNSGELRIQREGNTFTSSATVGEGTASHTYNIQTTTVAISLSLSSTDSNSASASVDEFVVTSGNIQADPFSCPLDQRD